MKLTETQKLLLFRIVLETLRIDSCVFSHTLAQRNDLINEITIAQDKEEL